MDDGLQLARMDDEVEVVRDADGVAIIGDSLAVTRFLSSRELVSQAVDMPHLGLAMGGVGVAAQVGAEIGANVGKWVKLTDDSFSKFRAIGMMKGSNPGVVRAVFHTGGQAGIRGIAEFTKGSLLANPAMLGGVGTLMAQLAIQQAMKEITAYLAAIDVKVDRVLRAQKDGVLADMIGAGMIIDDAMTVRDEVGQVSEVTWSKVQHTAGTIASTQAYALRQLDAIAEELDSYGSSVHKLKDAIPGADRRVIEWSAVLAQCVQLQDALAVLELDRVMGVSPVEAENHRRGIRRARHHRLESIDAGLSKLLGRLRKVADVANDKVLFHPQESPALVEAVKQVADHVEGLQKALELATGDRSLSARAWGEAVRDTRDAVRDSVAEAASKTKELGAKVVDVFQESDRDGDGIPDPSLAQEKVAAAGRALKSAVDGVAEAVLPRGHNG